MKSFKQKHTYGFVYKMHYPSDSSAVQTVLHVLAQKYYELNMGTVNHLNKDCFYVGACVMGTLDKGRLLKASNSYSPTYNGVNVVTLPPSMTPKELENLVFLADKNLTRTDLFLHAKLVLADPAPVEIPFKKVKLYRKSKWL